MSTGNKPYVSLEDIRKAIGDTMATVKEIGVINPYERYADKEKEFRDLYTRKVDSKYELRGWFIRHTASRETFFTSLSTIIERDWQIRGFIGLRDAEMTEIVLDHLAEALRYAFKRNLTLGGLVLPPSQSDQPVGLQLTESGPYMFGGVLSNSVTFTLTTRNYGSTTISADEVAALDDFKTFHANWDLPPFGNVPPPLPADDAADATDDVTLPTDD